MCFVFGVFLVCFECVFGVFLLCFWCVVVATGEPGTGSRGNQGAEGRGGTKGLIQKIEKQTKSLPNPGHMDWGNQGE